VGLSDSYNRKISFGDIGRTIRSVFGNVFKKKYPNKKIWKIIKVKKIKFQCPVPEKKYLLKMMIYYSEPVILCLPRTLNSDRLI